MSSTVRLGRGVSYRLRHGSFHLRIYDPERSPAERSVTLRTDSPALAARRASRYFERYASGLWDPWHGPPESPTVAEAVAQYKRERRGSSRPRSIYSTVRVVERLARDTKRPIDAIRPGEVRDFVNRSGISQATRASYFRWLRAWFAWAVRCGMMRENPCRPEDRPQTPRTLPDGLTLSELAQILGRAGEDAEARPRGPYARWAVDALELLAWTGLRPSEASRLRWDDLSADSIRVRSRRTVRTKTDRERSVTLIPQARRVLDRLERRADTVLVAADGRSPVSVPWLSRQFLAARVAAGLPERLSLYSLRHTFAAEYRRRGGSLSMLQQELGHASITTTERYGYLGDDERSAYTRRLFT